MINWLLGILFVQSILIIYIFQSMLHNVAAMHDMEELVIRMFSTLKVLEYKEKRRQEGKLDEFIDNFFVIEEEENE